MAPTIDGPAKIIRSDRKNRQDYSVNNFFHAEIGNFIYKLHHVSRINPVFRDMRNIFYIFISSFFLFPRTGVYKIFVRAKIYRRVYFDTTERKFERESHMRALQRHEFSIRHSCQINSRSEIKWIRSHSHLRSRITPKLLEGCVTREWVTIENLSDFYMYPSMKCADIGFNFFLNFFSYSSNKIFLKRKKKIVSKLSPVHCFSKTLLVVIKAIFQCVKESLKISFREKKLCKNYN